MSSLKISVTSWGEVALDKRELRKLMRSAGNEVKQRTSRLISPSQGSGRLYRGGGGSRYRGAYVAKAYRASAPGEPPVAVSGTLRASLKVYPYPSGEGFAVRERAFYSVFLAGGARGPGRRVLDPRPSLDRVMQDEAKNLDRRVRAALTQALTWKQTKTL